MTYLIEPIDRSTMNLPAVSQRSDQILQHAFSCVSPVSPHDIVDHVVIHTDGYSPANKFTIRYKFVDNYPINVKGIFIDIRI